MYTRGDRDSDIRSGGLETIAQRYFAAWTHRDPDEIAALHTARTSFCTHMGAPPVVGRAAVRDAFAEVFEQFPDFAFDVERDIHRVLYGQRHWVLDWTLVSGDVRIDCLDIVEVAGDGGITRKDTYLDAVQMNIALEGRR